MVKDRFDNYMECAEVNPCIAFALCIVCVTRVVWEEIVGWYNERVQPKHR